MEEATYFRYLARAVPSGSLLQGEDYDQPVFTQFSKEELEQLDPVMLGSQFEHTGTDSVAYVVDKISSDDNTMLVFMEIPPDTQLSTEEETKRVRELQANLKTMIKGGYIPDVSLSHWYELQKDPEQQMMLVTKHLQEVSTTTKGARSGSNIIIYTESPEPYSKKLHKERQDRIIREHEALKTAKPTDSREVCDARGFMVTDKGEIRYTNRGSCKSVLKYEAGDIEKLPPIVQASIKNFTYINNPKDGKTKNPLIIDREKLTGASEKKMSNPNTNTNTQTQSKDDLGGLMKKIEDLQKQNEALKKKADGYDELTSAQEQKAKQEIQRAFTDMYKKTMSLAQSLIPKVPEAVTTKNQDGSTSIVQPPSVPLTKEQEEAKTILDTLSQQLPKTEQTIGEVFSKSADDKIAFDAASFQDMLTNFSYPLAAYNTLAEIRNKQMETVAKQSVQTQLVKPAISSSSSSQPPQQEQKVRFVPFSKASEELLNKKRKIITEDEAKEDAKIAASNAQ